MDSSKQRIVVRGAGGIIGGHLVEELLRDGVQVIRPVDVKPRSEWYQIHPGAENVAADLKQIDACHRAVEGADAIFNLTADMGGMGFMESDIHEPINLGSSELVSIDQLVDIAESFAGIKFERAPRDVDGRNSDNTMIKARLGSEPATQLRQGLRKTYDWIESQIEALTCV